MSHHPVVVLRLGLIARHKVPVLSNVGQLVRWADQIVLAIAQLQQTLGRLSSRHLLLLLAPRSRLLWAPRTQVHISESLQVVLEIARHFGDRIGNQENVQKTQLVHFQNQSPLKQQLF